MIIINKLRPIVAPIWCVSKIWIGWITIHWFAVTLYAEECSGRTFFKIIASPLTSQSPPCRGLLWAINTSSDAIKHMWILAGGWIMIKLTSILKYKEE